MPLLKTAFDETAPSFSRLLASLSPHLVVYDFLMPWAPSAASRLNIPAVLFLPIAASNAALFSHLLLQPHRQFPFFPNLDLHHFTSLKATDGDRFLQCIDRSTNFIAVRTFREIESQYIDHLATLIGKEVVPVGPLLSDSISEGGEELEWLKGKEEGTVVFVSVGSECFMGEEEMEELATGLALCGLWSIWVVRFEGGGGRGKGFSWERGLVVEGWAAQRRILAHPSVGGFVTHCGWSSVMEGMREGVGMVAMPMGLDQPSNAELMVELGVAVKAEREEGSGVYRGEEVARCIREVMVGEKREGVRRRVEELGRIVGSKGFEEIEVLRKRFEELVRVDGNSIKD